MGNHRHASEGARLIKAWLKPCRILLAWATLVSAVGLAAASDTVLRVVTYNSHGGVGPNGEGNLSSNMTAFRNLLQGEDVICLQEVPQGSGWTTVKTIFADYPYAFATGNTTTDSIWPWQTRPTDYNVILSKFPFLGTDSALIQTDPGGNKWQRHAQYVSVQIGSGTLHVFNFHNTYNWFNNDYQYEQSGLVSFRNYVNGTLGVANLGDGGKLVMAGDFNLLEDKVAVILPTPARSSNGLDHVCTIPLQQNAGSYDTYGAGLSDHNAVWAAADVRAPDPDPAQWSVVPAPAGAGRITMTAITATDVNGVQYFFANTSFTNGSHDSAWQTSPVFTDTGLTKSTTYSYRVKARDSSANHNETVWSVVQAATTNSSSTTACDLVSFNWGSYVGAINPTARTVSLVVPYFADLTTLAPACTASGGAALSPASGVQQDFSGSVANPLQYTVTAEDGVTTKTYAVTVTAGTLILDTFGTGSWAVGASGRTPDTTDLPGSKWTGPEGYWFGTYPTAIVGGHLKVFVDGGYTLSLASNGSYTYPTLLRISADLTVNGLSGTANNGTSQPRGLTVGLSTNQLGADTLYTKIVGLNLRENGSLTLFDQTTNVATVAWSGAAAFDKTQSYHLSYDVDTSSGQVSNISLVGSTANYSGLQLARPHLVHAQYAAVTFNADAVGATHFGYLDNFSLSVTAAAGAGYAQWESGNGASGGAGADSNHNGVPNGIEYFMGGTALAPATLPPLVNTAGTWTWTLAYDPAAAASYHFGVSADLASWTPLAPGDPKLEVLTSPGDAIRLTLPDGMRFCRLVVAP